LKIRRIEIRKRRTDLEKVNFGQELMQLVGWGLGKE
jgi:hypothetical protein